MSATTVTIATTTAGAGAGAPPPSSAEQFVEVVADLPSSAEQSAEEDEVVVDFQEIADDCDSFEGLVERLRVQRPTVEQLKMALYRFLHHRRTPQEPEANTLRDDARGSFQTRLDFLRRKADERRLNQRATRFFKDEFTNFIRTFSLWITSRNTLNPDTHPGSYPTAIYYVSADLLIQKMQEVHGDDNKMFTLAKCFDILTSMKRCLSEMEGEHDWVNVSKDATLQRLFTGQIPTGIAGASALTEIFFASPEIRKDLYKKKMAALGIVVTLKENKDLMAQVLNEYPQIASEQGCHWGRVKRMSRASASAPFGLYPHQIKTVCQFILVQLLNIPFLKINTTVVGGGKTELASDIAVTCHEMGDFCGTLVYGCESDAVREGVNKKLSSSLIAVDARFDAITKRTHLQLASNGGKPIMVVPPQTVLRARGDKVPITINVFNQRIERFDHTTQFFMIWDAVGKPDIIVGDLASVDMLLHATPFLFGFFSSILDEFTMSTQGVQHMVPYTTALVDRIRQRSKVCFMWSATAGPEENYREMVATHGTTFGGTIADEDDAELRNIREGDQIDALGMLLEETPEQNQAVTGFTLQKKKAFKPYLDQIRKIVRREPDSQIRPEIIGELKTWLNQNFYVGDVIVRSLRGMVTDAGIPSTPASIATDRANLRDILLRLSRADRMNLTAWTPTLVEGLREQGLLETLPTLLPENGRLGEMATTVDDAAIEQMRVNREHIEVIDAQLQSATPNKEAIVRALRALQAPETSAVESATLENHQLLSRTSQAVKALGYGEQANQIFQNGLIAAILREPKSNDLRFLANFLTDHGGNKDDIRELRDLAEFIQEVICLRNTEIKVYWPKIVEFGMTRLRRRDEAALTRVIALERARPENGGRGIRAAEAALRCLRGTTTSTYTEGPDVKVVGEFNLALREMQKVVDLLPIDSVMYLRYEAAIRCLEGIYSSQKKELSTESTPELRALEATQEFASIYMRLLSGKLKPWIQARNEASKALLTAYTDIAGSHIDARDLLTKATDPANTDTIRHTLTEKGAALVADLLGARVRAREELENLPPTKEARVTMIRNKQSKIEVALVSVKGLLPDARRRHTELKARLESAKTASVALVADMRCLREATEAVQSATKRHADATATFDATHASFEAAQADHQVAQAAYMAAQAACEADTWEDHCEEDGSSREGTEDVVAIRNNAEDRAKATHDTLLEATTNRDVAQAAMKDAEAELTAARGVLSSISVPDEARTAHEEYMRALKESLDGGQEVARLESVLECLNADKCDMNRQEQGIQRAAHEELIAARAALVKASKEMMSHNERVTNAHARLPVLEVTFRETRKKVPEEMRTVTGMKLRKEDVQIIDRHYQSLRPAATTIVSGIKHRLRASLEQLESVDLETVMDWTNAFWDAVARSNTLFESVRSFSRTPFPGYHPLGLSDILVPTRPEGDDTGLSLAIVNSEQMTKIMVIAGYDPQPSGSTTQQPTLTKEEQERFSGVQPCRLEEGVPIPEWVRKLLKCGIAVIRRNATRAEASHIYAMVENPVHRIRWVIVPDDRANGVNLTFERVVVLTNKIFTKNQLLQYLGRGGRGRDGRLRSSVFCIVQVPTQESEMVYQAPDATEVNTFRLVQILCNPVIASHAQKAEDIGRLLVAAAEDQARWASKVSECMSYLPETLRPLLQNLTTHAHRVSACQNILQLLHEETDRDYCDAIRQYNCYNRERQSELQATSSAAPPVVNARSSLLRRVSAASTGAQTPRVDDARMAALCAAAAERLREMHETRDRVARCLENCGNSRNLIPKTPAPFQIRT